MAPITKISKVIKKLKPTNTHQYIFSTIITTTKIQDDKKIGTLKKTHTHKHKHPNINKLRGKK